MRFIACALTALTVLFGLATAQLRINTPASVVACQPVLIVWSGGFAPYYLAWIPAGVAGAPDTVISPSLSGTSFTWTANLAAGTSITLKVMDAIGSISYTSVIIIQAGPGSSSLGDRAAGGASGGTSRGNLNYFRSSQRGSIGRVNPQSGTGGTDDTGDSDVAPAVSSFPISPSPIPVTTINAALRISSGRGRNQTGSAMFRAQHGSGLMGFMGLLAAVGLAFWAIELDWMI